MHSVGQLLLGNPGANWFNCMIVGLLAMRLLGVEASHFVLVFPVLAVGFVCDVSTVHLTLCIVHVTK